MFNWVEIALEASRVQFELLSNMLNEAGFENEVHFIETTVDDFESILFESLDKYDGIRIGQGLGEQVANLYGRQSLMVDRVRAADTLVKENGEWWLRANLIDAFGRVLNSVGEKVDIGSPALVIGSGAAVKMVITSLFISGLKRFSIANLDVSEANRIVTDLKRIHLGIEIRVIPKSELTLLPATHGILVNATSMSKGNPMLEEIYYFNFLKSNGLAIDLSIRPVETALLNGARDVGAHCIYGYSIAAEIDLLWLKQISGDKIKLIGYEKKLFEKLSTLSPGADASK